MNSERVRSAAMALWFISRNIRSLMQTRTHSVRLSASAIRKSPALAGQNAPRRGGARRESLGGLPRGLYVQRQVCFEFPVCKTLDLQCPCHGNQLWIPARNGALRDIQRIRELLLGSEVRNGVN